MTENKRMSQIYEGPARVTYYDLDYRGKLKLSALLRLVHIAAEENAIELGSGYRDLSPLRMSYVIQRFGADIARLPGYGEDVVIRTWPSAINSGVFVRKGDMYDAKGTQLMNWESLWVLFDLNSRKILKSSALPRQFTGVDVPGMTAKASKILLQDDWGEPFSNYSHKVRYSEVDTNRHMNNSIYGDLAGNALYMGENPAAEDWAGVQINFLAETRLGDEMEISCRYGRENEHGLFWVTGCANGKNSFMATVKCR
jgi:acyl-ACP thioesterase